ncbi:hypothetical protein RR48_09120 [Papilio machaon]|uniref:Uncharacterized protein n=1 Tax=Papilio machaon TaxID=76193 RepID=A0A194RB90_PAPMA|nr:hypothetical protein RR48_09120 [Papilio machaon]
MAGACAPHPPHPVLSPLRTNRVTLCLPIAAIDEIVGRSAIPTSLAPRSFIICHSLVGRNDRDINRRVMTL